jgi:hypothetical protein
MVMVRQRIVFERRQTAHSIRAGVQPERPLRSFGDTRLNWDFQR